MQFPHLSRSLAVARIIRKTSIEYTLKKEIRNSLDPLFSHNDINSWTEKKQLDVLSWAWVEKKKWGNLFTQQWRRKSWPRTYRQRDAFQTENFGFVSPSVKKEVELNWLPADFDSEIQDSSSWHKEREKSQLVNVTRVLSVRIIKEESQSDPRSYQTVLGFCEKDTELIFPGSWTTIRFKTGQMDNVRKGRNSPLITSTSD